MFVSVLDANMLAGNVFSIALSYLLFEVLQ